jgi:hydroxymethylglutaryl-CoA reductase
MAIEESSVVAAAAKAAKFWSTRGGFKTTVINTEKIGQVHFIYKGDESKLYLFFAYLKSKLFEATESITKNMQKRGGGILDIILKDKTNLLPNYYQLHATFETKDSMGANFINSCLEQFAKTLKEGALDYELFSEEEKNIEVVMSILSNYVPNCIVRAEVSCPIEELAEKHILNPQDFAEKFIQAVRIAEVEPFRAVTHNKGIMNGIDAVVLATGNDFRAVEAGIHAYASRNGHYSSLSHAKIENGIFSFWLEIPLALGTVGGLTSLHPLVKLSLEMLEKPSAKELMQIVAVAGLAQNFAALRSLTTTGIQDGHMKMHLNNILNQFEANDEERILIKKHFKHHVVSHSAVVECIENLRKDN